MSVSTHVLDTVRGIPAAGMGVTLHRFVERDWVEVAQATTDADGRVGDLSEQTPVGDHRIVFDTGGYFGTGAFYPQVTVTFRVSDATAHHHVPLLVSPFSYTTYRGS